MKIQGPPTWFQITNQDLPFNFGEVRFLMVLDPFNRPSPCGGRLGLWARRLVPYAPWNPRVIGSKGPPIAPMDHGLQTVGHQNTK
ncbi:hypothetical protein O181_097680 [Austropuccinia psidii MF-1]|uniref:Uncharacterized protein n=1 Tax=Austropuccinia psidii MF-1 TaxID=1389203 RepID=A0A9Q3JA22_9BASI|nr:hypothetical protein [Austropuccinia psidii MF-1]